MSRDIATEVADDGVATLTLARPERRNALSIKLRNEITEQLDSWADGSGRPRGRTHRDGIHVLRRL